MSTQVFQEMIGATIERVIGKVGDGEMYLDAVDGRRFGFWHEQDCCENVSIEDIAGDVADLVGSTILQAEEVSNEDADPPARDYVESFTWTFYKFATAKGSVTVRWLGESNGYYSEGVSYNVGTVPACIVHEDCAANPALGRACLSPPSRDSNEEKKP